MCIVHLQVMIHERRPSNIIRFLQKRRSLSEESNEIGQRTQWPPIFGFSNLDYLARFLSAKYQKLIFDKLTLNKRNQF